MFTDLVKVKGDPIEKDNIESPHHLAFHYHQSLFRELEAKSQEIYALNKSNSELKSEISGLKTSILIEKEDLYKLRFIQSHCNNTKDLSIKEIERLKEKLEIANNKVAQLQAENEAKLKIEKMILSSDVNALKDHLNTIRRTKAPYESVKIIYDVCIELMNTTIKSSEPIKKAKQHVVRSYDKILRRPHHAKYM